MRDLNELTVFITGATDGLGERVALDLAGRGASLLLHGRDPEKGRRVLAKISEETDNNRLRYFNADLSSLAEVRRLALAVEESSPRLDVLINNAGLGAGPDPKRRQTSADGFELIFAVNYLAPFLLTRRLLPLLKRSATDAGKARVVNVASAAQRAIDFYDVMLERNYDGMRAYSQSKLALVMFSFDLAEELAGTGVTVSVLHPASLMDTKMVREWFGAPRSTVGEGARYVERLAVAEELDAVSGSYYDQGEPARAERQAYDDKARRRLRELSMMWTGEQKPV
jgi:NAD(P)-dependent dehydrogenase (short-subunit alcohol dehydrogenase family)